MLVGLTGGYCAGKNAVAALLESRGFLCFDLDRLGHEAMDLEETQEAIAWRFGPEALGKGGVLDRRALGALVFADKEGLADLEAIVHPAVYRLLRPRLAAALAEGRQVCLNAALLYRMPEAGACDFVIEVVAPLRTRLERGKKRDGLDPRAVLARIWSQRTFWRLRRSLEREVFFLRNKGGLTELELGLERLLGRAAKLLMERDHNKDGLPRQATDRGLPRSGGSL